MKYTLYKSEEGYILTTDEEIKVGDYRLDFYESGNPGRVRKVEKIIIVDGDNDKIFDYLPYNLRSSVVKVITSTFILKLPKIIGFPEHDTFNNKWNVEVEYSCKGIQIEGASCRYNQQCTYPNCGEYKLINIL